jgi:hypothetical protein
MNFYAFFFFWKRAAVFCTFFGFGVFLKELIELLYKLWCFFISGDIGDNLENFCKDLIQEFSC